MVYYNEIDPFAAAWLRELIKEGHIASGEVDERDIRSIEPSDLRGYTQCHFFAGIGGWSYALRLAGWTDDTPVWTGSCPCQPFSAAGKRRGIEDERHLWPVWFELIQECRPPVIFGEQVSGPAGLAWLDIVYADMEGAGYAVGAADLGAAGVGAPHIRQRLWFVADAAFGHAGTRRGNAGEVRGVSEADRQQEYGPALPGRGSTARVLAHSLPAGRAEGRSIPRDGPIAGSGISRILANPGGDQRGAGWSGGTDGNGSQQPAGRRDDGLLGDSDCEGLARPSRQSGDDGEEQPTAERAGGDAGSVGNANGIGEEAVGGVQGWSHTQRKGGFWATAGWVPCRDGKLRPIEPGTFPLASRVPGRVGLLRGYGNAIVPPLAAEFIAAYREAAGLEE